MISTWFTLLAFAGTVHSQPGDGAQPAGKSDSGLATSNDPPSGPKRLESLDELLGIVGEAKAGKAVPTPEQLALSRQLSPQEIHDEFEQILQLMKQTADRVETGKDVGIETQRMQEEIIQKLEKVLADAIKQQQQQQQQQQQDQQQDQQQKQNESQSKSGQQKQQGEKEQGFERDKSQAQQQTKAGNASGNKDGMKRETGEIKPPPLQGSAAWGNLPPHIRESLLQGRGDAVSSAYRRMTEQYFKRLAEEPKK